MEKYRTVSGDTWDIIAFKLYKNHHIKALLDVNKAYIDVLVFEGGLELNIPQTNVNSSSSLPPWKRGD